MLETNPDHHGTNYLLATALDRAGDRAEARPQWERLLKMAEGFNGKPTAETARSRLAGQQ